MESLLKTWPLRVRRASHVPAKALALLEEAGIQVNGSRPHDMQVHDLRTFRRALTQGSVGLGEAYMEGWWDCEALDQFFFRILRKRLDQRVSSRLEKLHDLRAWVMNLQTPSRAYQVGRHHYDIGNGLYRSMLGSHMVYSCGYWARATNLDEAQIAKLDLICRKLEIHPGMRVLDIGCGWGAAARHIAERYGAQVTGITISAEQAHHARLSCRDLPVDIRIQDYRSLNERFDRILSVGMFEHVGYKNYNAFMRIVRRCLKPGGRLLLHTIGSHFTRRSTDPWIARYIFPNSMVPSMRQVSEAIGDLMVMEDWQNFGVDYDRTLLAWHRNFEAGWPDLASEYGETFRRMWRYYLLSSAASFRARSNQLWQIVLAPSGLAGGYRAVC
jgi:cyclopropane-fatty-acyl-phospholipid synthase